MKTLRHLATLGAVSAVMAFAVAPSSAQLNQAIDEAEGATRDAQQSQARIDQLDEQRGDLFREYRATLQRIDSQKLFVEQQRVFLQSQENELRDLESQIDTVEDVLAGLTSMPIDMIESLDQFIALDLPFLRDVRQARIARLRDLMDQPDVTPAEKYRQILQAYEIETDYGRFLRHYEGPKWDNPDVSPDVNAPTVDYLMIGRVAFIYMSQDESELAVWDADAGAWRELPDSFRLDIRQAIRMAKEVTTPDVFFAPVIKTVVDQ